MVQTVLIIFMIFLILLLFVLKRNRKLSEKSLHNAIYEAADNLSQRAYHVPFYKLPDGWTRWGVIRTARSLVTMQWHIAKIGKNIDKLSVQMQVYNRCKGCYKS